MAIEYQIDPEMGVIYVNLSGVVRELEFVTAADDALHDPKCYPGIDFLIDSREIERFEVNSQTIRRVAGMMSDRMDEYDCAWKVAIIAPTEPVYGISQLYRVMREGSMEEVGIFQTAKSARVWLGLPEEGAEA